MHTAGASRRSRHPYMYAPSYAHSNEHESTCIAAMEGRHIGSKPIDTPDRLPKAHRLLACATSVVVGFV
jgi:hypothetical protein